MKDIFLIDADDTILDFHTSSSQALLYAFSSCGLVWEDAYAAIYKSLNERLWEALERKELTRNELMDRRFPDFLQVLGVKHVSGEQFNEKYLEYLSTRPVYIDGAKEFLKTLGKMGRVYIVTNGTEWIQKSRFRISRLYDYADDVFISEQAGYDKPSPLYTQYVIERIPNFDKKRAIWVGDSLTADIKAASDANITSIWFNRTQKERKGNVFPDFTVKKFQEILQILQTQ